MGPRDYKHIVCGTLNFTVVPSEVIKDGIGMTSRTAGMIVSRGVFMEAIQGMVRNPDSIPILSKMVRFVCVCVCVCFVLFFDLLCPFIFCRFLIFFFFILLNSFLSTACLVVVNSR